MYQVSSKQELNNIPKKSDNKINLPSSSLMTTTTNVNNWIQIVLKMQCYLFPNRNSIIEQSGLQTSKKQMMLGQAIMKVKQNIRKPKYPQSLPLNQDIHTTLDKEILKNLKRELLTMRNIDQCRKKSRKQWKHL